MARILLATFGSLGDLHPYIAVGRALAARGLVARIATCSDYRSQVEGAGLEFAAVAPSLAELGTPQELANRVSDPMFGTEVLVRDLSDCATNQDLAAPDKRRMLGTAAKARVIIPATAQLFQTNALCSGTEYSPLNIFR